MPRFPLPRQRIARKGGSQTRLSVSGAAFLALIHWAGPLSAHENPLQSLLGLDYDRQIWMPCDAPVSPLEKGPGFPAAAQLRDHARAAGENAAGLPGFSAVLTFGYLDLIRKTGAFAFDHSETLFSLDLATTAVPHLEIRFAADRFQRDLDLGDAHSGIDLGASTWGWTGSAAYLLTPLFVPALIVGGNSRDSHDNDLKALSLRGAAAPGWDWSLALGEKNLAYPLAVEAPDYRPLSVGMRLRRKFRDLALRFRRGPWEGFWAGHWEESRYPHVRPEGYGLADSGSAWKHSAGAAFDRLRGGDSGRGSPGHGGYGNYGGYRASLDFEMGYGKHVFRGTNRKGENLYAFSYQEGAQKSYSLRSDLRAQSGRWEWGAYAGAAESEYDALRPDVAFNRYFWDRNGVLDSYQGGLLGVFNNETWLFNGAAYLAQAGGGAWGATRLGGWRGRLGLGYQHLTLESNSHLTKRETTFLLAYREERIDKTYPRVDADILTPELRVGTSWGRMEVMATAAQAVPIQVDMDGKSGATSGTSKRGSRYSGFTRARLELGWRMP
ncbi:MAG TPA: hypothetical protein VJ385_13240 [Fibrobacteria bacterium]|nr:hypothetical protein [Fibrobacteria bacterium]